MSRRLTCPECGRFFGYDNIRSGQIRLKCPNCKNWTIVKATLINDELTKEGELVHNDDDSVKL